MKLTFEQSDLLKSVTIAMKAVPSKTTMPVLYCILIDASADTIHFVSNDMELGIDTTVKGTIIERGAVAIDAKTFSEIIRRVPESTVTIESDDSLLVKISCDKAKFEIPGKPSEEFTALPAIERDDSVTITQFSLRQIINQTIFSAAVNENNKIMTGELFEIQDGRLRVVALDGHRIAIRNLELSNPCSDRKIIVPGKTLSEISRIITGGLEDTVTLYFSDNHILFAFDDTIVLSRLIAGNYFNISQMLSEDYSTKIEVNKQELTACMFRASLLVRESDKLPVILNISENELALAIDTELGSMDESIEIQMEGNDLRIGFNPKFLLDALRAIDDETVSIHFISPIAPCYIQDEDRSYMYMVLPVNILR